MIIAQQAAVWEKKSVSRQTWRADCDLIPCFEKPLSESSSLSLWISAAGIRNSVITARLSEGVAAAEGTFSAAAAAAAPAYSKRDTL